MGKQKDSAKKHIRGLDAYKKHSAHSTGCIMICTSSYQRGKAHSHRWHAAERARNEEDVPYTHYDLYGRSTIWRSEEWLRKMGATGIKQDKGDRYEGQVEAFTTEDSPFFHNAHHIIPVGVLAGTILDTAKNAEPNETPMQNLIVGGLIDEPYNINDEPNMIVLPTQLGPSEILGLPIHLEGKKKHHPNYSRKVKKYVFDRFGDNYDDVASQVAQMEHDDDAPDPKPMKDCLENISNTIYKVIIELAKSSGRVGESLDAVSHSLMCRFARAYSK